MIHTPTYVDTLLPTYVPLTLLLSLHTHVSARTHTYSWNYPYVGRAHIKYAHNHNIRLTYPDGDRRITL